MPLIAQQKWKEELAMYDAAMKERDTLLRVFRHLIDRRTYPRRRKFLAKVRRFVMVDLLRNALAV